MDRRGSSRVTRVAAGAAAGLVVAGVSIWLAWPRGASTSAPLDARAAARRDRDAGGRSGPSDPVARRGTDPARPSPSTFDPPTPEQLALAEGFAAMYASDDHQWLHDAFVQEVKTDGIAEMIDWFRLQVGDCTSHEAIHTGGAGQARFLYACERGELEVGFQSDREQPEKLRRMRLGLRGVEPMDGVREAAAGAVSLITDWDRPRFEGLFAASWNADEMEIWFADVHAERGACRLGDVDLAGPRGALWFLDCEAGPALMKTTLDDDDRIRRFFIHDRRGVRPEP